MSLSYQTFLAVTEGEERCLAHLLTALGMDRETPKPRKGYGIELSDLRKQEERVRNIWNETEQTEKKRAR